MVVARGDVEFFEGGLPTGSQFLLLGSSEEGGVLHIIDEARTFTEAKEKAALFLEDHPCGGVLVTKHLVAVYRLPIFPKQSN